MAIDDVGVVCSSRRRDAVSAVARSLKHSVLMILTAWLMLLRIDQSQANAGESAMAAAASHPISITEASFYVTRSRGVMQVQLFAEDLLLFQGLEPNDQDRIVADDLRAGLESHKKFLVERVLIRDADGNLIKGQVTDLKSFEIPADGIPTTELMSHTAMYELEFLFSQPPEFLTIQQDISDDNYIIPSEMRLNVHQAGTALNMTEMLKPGDTTTVRFDWESALSEDATDAEWDTWFEQQREKTLGITSYSSVYSFIYIEPAEVRHEILIPLATLKTILPIKHRDSAWVEIDEQEAVRELIRGWLKEKAPVQINGTQLSPEFSRIDLYSLNLSDFATKAAEQRISMASGRVGIILKYQTPDDSVRDVALAWNLFYSAMTKIPAVVVAWPNQMARFEFSRFNVEDDNTFKWTCPPEAMLRAVEPVAASIGPRPMLTIPCGGLAAIVVGGLCCLLKARPAKLGGIAASCIIAAAIWTRTSLTIEHPWREPPELSAAEAEQVFDSLLHGMYRAMDFGSAERVYDVLATTVGGELLEELYLQLRRSLEVRDQGGAIARIRDVTFESGQTAARAETTAAWPAVEYRSTWTVAGTIEHWGHVHERQNQFEAIFTLEPRDGCWKITRMDIQGQTQKSAKTTLRKF